MKKRILSMLLVIVMILSVVPVQALAAGVTLTGQTYVMEGKNVTVTAKGAVIADFQACSTDNPNVATVTYVDGTRKFTVHGEGKGHTTVRIRMVDGTEYPFEIDVYAQEPQGSVAVDTAITGTEVTQGAGSVQLKYTCAVPDGDFKVVKWESSNTAVAEVTENGMLIPKDTGVTGTTNVRVQVNGRWSPAVTFTVAPAGGSSGGSSGSGGGATPPSADGPLAFDRTSVVMDGYGKETITADVPAGEDASKVIWSVVSGDACTIDYAGKTCTVTGKKVGSARLRATLNKAGGGVLTGEIDVTVNQLPATAIEFVKPLKKSMTVGETHTPQVKLTPEGATTAVRWESTKPAFASIDPVTGEITALSAGATLIRAYISDTVFASYRLEVSEATHIQLDSEIPDRIVAGRGVALKASVVDAAGNAVPNTSVKWTLVTEEEGVSIEGNELKTSYDMKYRHHIELRVEAVGCDAKALTVTTRVMPATTDITLKVGDEKVNDKVHVVNLADSAIGTSGIVISASILPASAEQSIRWEVADAGNICTEIQGIMDLKLTPVSTLKSGTVTVTAYAGDGSGEYATTTIQFSRLGEGKLKNVPDKLRGGMSLNMKSYLEQDKDLDDTRVTWKVQNNYLNGVKIASISAAGKLTTSAVTTPHEIEVTVIGSSGGSDTKKITLYPATKSITLSATSNVGININGTSKTIKYKDGMEFYLTPDVKPAEANVWELKWISSDKKVADFDPNTGALLILDAGKVRITCETTDGTRIKGYLNLEITKDAANVQITAPAKTLASTKSMNLTATVWARKNVKAANQAVIWSVSDEYGEPTGAATVSSTGRLTAYEVNQNTVVVVTATSKQNNEVYGTFNVTIKPNTTKTLHAFIDGNMITGTYAMNLGESCVVDAAWQKSGNGRDAVAEGCQFFSSNSKVVTVDENLGTLEAVGYGTATITMRCVDPATKNEYTSTFNVQVLRKVGTVTITAPSITDLRSGTSVYLWATAWLDYANGVRADNQTFTWEVTEGGKPTDVATINANGVLTAKSVDKKHTVQVKAISKESSIYATVTFNIFPAEVVKFYFTLNGEEYTGTLPVDLNQGMNGLGVRIYTAITNQDGTITERNITPKASELTWTTTNKTVVDTPNNKPKALSVGKAMLTVRYNKAIGYGYYLGSINVNVNQTVGSVTIEQPGILVAGKAIYMRAKAANANATNKNVLWSVEGPNKDYVTINPYNGKLSAKKGFGGYDVTVRAVPVDGSRANTETVHVFAATTSVEIKKGATVLNGKTYFVGLSSTSLALDATAEPIDAYQTTFKWTSSNPNVAEVKEDGTVILKKAGATTIKAIAQDGTNKTAKFTLRVTN